MWYWKLSYLRNTPTCNHINQLEATRETSFYFSGRNRCPAFKKSLKKRKAKVSEHIDFLNTLEVEDELYDEMIDNMQLLVFLIHCNLDIEQEQAIRKFIVSNIGKKMMNTN
jgi:hypothetical protein